MVLETLIKLCMKTQIFGKTFFASKIREMGQNRVFLNLKKNLVISFHRIYSIMKILLFAVFINNPIFGKNLTSEI